MPHANVLLVDERSDIEPTLLSLPIVRRADVASIKDALARDHWDAIVVAWPPLSPEVARRLAERSLCHPATLVIGLSASVAFDEDGASAETAMDSGARFLVPFHQRRALPRILERALAERHAMAAKDRLHALILESAGEGIYGVDTKGAVTFVNPAAARMIGWDRDELFGQKQHAILHHTRPDGTPYPVEECPIYAAFSDGQVHHESGELFFRKDGTGFPVDYISTPIREEDKLTGAVVTFRDISERRAAEEAMARHQEELERLQAELVATMRELLATEDMVFASQSVAQALLPVIADLRSLSALAPMKEPREILGRALVSLESLRHLTGDAAPTREACDVGASVSRALAEVGGTPPPVPAGVLALASAEDLTRAVSQLAALLGADRSVEVWEDDGVPSVRLEGSLLGRPGVGLLFARRLIGRNGGALETRVPAPGQRAFIVRLAPPTRDD